MRAVFDKFLRDVAGATPIEYGLLAALGASAVAGTFSVIGGPAGWGVQTLRIAMGDVCDDQNNKPGQKPATIFNFANNAPRSACKDLRR